MQSAKCKVQSAKCKVQSAKCKVQSTKCKGDMFSLNRRVFLFPLISFGFVCLIFCAMLLSGAEMKTFAAPGGATPSVLTTSLSYSSLDFQFSATEAANSEFKHYAISYTVTTNNKTGYKSYVSSVGEDTNLNNTDASATTRFTSINSDTASGNFAPKNWGYLIKDHGTYNPSQPYKPIPKRSAPDEIYSTATSGTGAGAATSYILGVDFGVKAGADLEPGLYTNNIVFTTITNYVPMEATFLPGQQFNALISNLDATHNVNVFKRSSVAPANIGAATVVSTADSERPIYAWFNAPDRTVYWWTDADVAYSNVNGNEMFKNINRDANEMELIDIRGINTSRTEVMHEFFVDGAKSVRNLNIDGIDTSNVWYMAGMFACQDSGATPKNPIDFSKIDVSKVTDISYMFFRSNFSSIDLSSWDTKRLKYVDGLFSGAIKPKNIDLSSWDVRSLLRTNKMFASAGTEHINLSGWNSNQLTDTSEMFLDTYALQTLNLDGFNTSNVTNMSGMFATSVVPNLNLSSFDTSKVTNMSSMFRGMQHLNTLNVSNFNTSSVTDFGQMFRGIVVADRTLNVLNFNTSNAVAMPMMFDGTNLIGNLDLSSFNTSKVIDMSNMFSNSVFLNSVNLSSFNTSAVTNMAGMFYRTLGMAVIDISKFNTNNVQHMEDMFRETGVVTIQASWWFNSNNVIDSSRMFMDAMHLVGQNGTAYNVTNPQDKTYARFDNAGGLPGYFTYKNPY